MGVPLLSPRGLGSVFPLPGQLEDLLGWAGCLDSSAPAEGQRYYQTTWCVWRCRTRSLEIVGLEWKLLKIVLCMAVMTPDNVCLPFGVWVVFSSGVFLLFHYSPSLFVRLT